ncbi:low affinity iron permease family protein [Albibacterium sp.]|uniref:low affinity iron permease family protein n=1 Tax=Albibacterium sp. TaxID=2952885 RepID=UPI002BD449F7|nr:low affinity iron permease family protein [Albibacterium sp.]HUH18518.1 low affinity iron permease family protein [Albibacterium sp.]
MKTIPNDNREIEKKKHNFFEKFANKITNWSGSSTAFTLAAFIVIAWAISGPLFNYSATWQLVINTGTTIITFLMVFLIQKSQNKDSKAIQLKLNELIAANRYTSNRMVDIEDLTEEELDSLHKFYGELAVLAKSEGNIHKSHSIDAAKELFETKRKFRNISKVSEESNRAGNLTPPTN